MLVGAEHLKSKLRIPFRHTDSGAELQPDCVEDFFMHGSGEVVFQNQLGDFLQQLGIFLQSKVYGLGETARDIVPDERALLRRRVSFAELQRFRTLGL